MKRSCFVLSVMALFVAVTCSEAIERDARVIDWIGIEMTPTGDVDGLSVFLWGEQALSPDVDMWSFLFGGQYGRMNPNFFDGVDFWSVGLGLRFYPMPATTLDATAHYGQYDMAGNPDVSWAAFTGKQRLLPESMPIQPYVSGTIGVRSADAIQRVYDGKTYDEDKVSSDAFIGFGGGVEISMLENMEIVLDLSRKESDAFDDDWLASVAMKYFWD